jgi:hypothetical protein
MRERIRKNPTSEEMGRRVLNRMRNGWVFTEMFGVFYEQHIKNGRDIHPINKVSLYVSKGLHYLIDMGYIEKINKEFVLKKEYR